MRRFFGYTTRCRSSAAACSAWRALWRSFRLALIGSVALLASSCRTTSGSTTIQKADSLRWQRKVSVALAAIPAKTLAFRIPPDSLRSLLEGEKLTKEADGLRLTAEVTGGSLNLRAETAGIPALTYTADESIDRIRDSSAGLTEQKEPAAATLLSRFKPVLNGVVMILILIINLIPQKYYM